MNTQPLNVDREVARRPIHEEHWCMHGGCKRWGSFGFDMRFGTEWYCAEHRPADYRGRE